MTTPAFLTTLGQRPEAITMALDALLPRYHYAQVVVLHTDADLSGIASAYKQLLYMLQADYPELSIHGEELTYENGQPLVDIHDQHSAEAYYRAVLEVLLGFRAAYTPIHLMIAGGRKAMSIYATLAAGLLFGEHDRVWTIHAAPALLRENLFHAPPGMRNQVQMIQLPIRPSHMLPGMMSGETVESLIHRGHSSPRQMFLDSLTREETRLVEALQQHPFAGNSDLADILDKSSKTIEHQFGSIYGKLLTHFNLQVADNRKRQALLDVLSGRV